MTSPKAVGTKRVVRVTESGYAMAQHDGRILLFTIRRNRKACRDDWGKRHGFTNEQIKESMRLFGYRVVKVGVDYGLTQPKPKRTGRNAGRTRK